MPLTPGTILNNRYRIIRLLGQGGFGAVYHAWDLTFEAPCAVKENFNDTPEAQRQFLREARLLHNLRHSNLPLVKDYFFFPDAGGTGGSAYLVMDYVEGEDLQQRLERTGKPLTEGEVLPWIEQVCDALSYLHSQNPPVIHRDIKPANIRIAPEGKAMLVDFGIAKVYDPGAPTTLGARAATPGFSPLEQYGRGGRTDARSDVYALGATLYTLLTGQTLPEAPERVFGEALPPPRRLNPTLSPRVEQAILKALEMQPEQRFQTVNEFKQALTSAPTPQAKASSIHPIKGKKSVTTSYPKSVPQRANSNVANARKKEWPKWGYLLWTWASILMFFLLLLTVSKYLPPLTEVTTSSTQMVTRQSTLASSQRTLEAQQTTQARTQTAAARITPTLLPLITDERGVRMALISAGEFQMGSDAGDDDERPVHLVYLDDYYIDIYEVTNTLFAEFFNALGAQWEDIAGWLDTNSTYTHIHQINGRWEVDLGFDDHPVVKVTWEGARAFCEWREARLPTEAEWEKAARGGLVGAKYPWGDDVPVCQKGANNGAKSNACEGQTVPVGSFAPNGYGLFDMAGNVWEWVWDIYEGDYYNHSLKSNPKGPTPEIPSFFPEFRVYRGGSWFSQPHQLRVANRHAGFYGNVESNIDLGFRCARSP